MRIKTILTLLVAITIVVGCHSGEKSTKNSSSMKKQTEPEMIIMGNADIPVSGNIKRDMSRAIVYKTRKDYSLNVPITLSEDKQKVVSYPDPIDLITNGKIQYPTKLIDGYWLDNRGINNNTAFTHYTYDEYSKMKSAPTTAQLLKSVIDSSPFIKIVDCGVRSNLKNEVEELNKLIKTNFIGVKQ